MRKLIIPALVLVLAATACDSYNDKRGRGDAPVTKTDDNGAEVINMPDLFANVASKCDGHGHRVYVVTHGKTDPPPFVIDDASCPGGVAR